MERPILIIALVVICTTLASAGSCTWKTYQNRVIKVTGSKYINLRGVTRAQCQTKCLAETSFKCAAVDYNKKYSNCFLTEISYDKAQRTGLLRAKRSDYDVLVCEEPTAKPPTPSCTWKTYTDSVIPVSGSKYVNLRGVTRAECQMKCLSEKEFKCAATNYDKTHEHCFLTDMSYEQAKENGKLRTKNPRFDVMVCEESTATVAPTTAAPTSKCPELAKKIGPMGEAYVKANEFFLKFGGCDAIADEYGMCEAYPKDLVNYIIPHEDYDCVMMMMAFDDFKGADATCINTFIDLHKKGVTLYNENCNSIKNLGPCQTAKDKLKKMGVSTSGIACEALIEMAANSGKCRSGRYLISSRYSQCDKLCCGPYDEIALYGRNTCMCNYVHHFFF